MTRDTPRLAGWLLKTFVSGPNRDTLLGDIAEQYTAGRTRLWYWRQVLAAIFISLYREVRSNSPMTIRALVVGWSLVFLSFPVQKWILRLPWRVVRSLYVRGWIIQPAQDILIFILISCVLAVGMGWIIGRLNRPNHAPAVLLFVASWFAVMVVTFPIYVVTSYTFNWPYRNFYVLGMGVVGNIACMFCTLAGGLLSAPAHPADIHCS